MYAATGARHLWPEPAGFCLMRKSGHPDYSFVHFITNTMLYLDGKPLALPPHACILYAPGTEQHFSCDEPLLHDWFHFRAESAPPLPVDKPFFPANTHFVTELTREIENEFFARRSGRDELIDLKIRELFIKLGRELEPCAPSPARPVLRADRAVREAFEGLREEMLHSLNMAWSVKALSERVGLSPSRFHELYRLIFGCSPIDDLIRARMDSAKRLLLFTSRSVSSISEALGYNNETHFIRQFKAAAGISPAKFRREGEKSDT